VLIRSDKTQKFGTDRPRILLGGSIMICETSAGVTDDLTEADTDLDAADDIEGSASEVAKVTAAHGRTQRDKQTAADK